MKRFGLLFGLLAVMAVLCLSSPMATAQELAGAWYVGDSQDGDGLIASQELTVIIKVVGGVCEPGTDFFSVHPNTSCETMEVSGDMVYGPTDLTTILNWVGGVWGDPADDGNPGRVFLLQDAATVASGSSVLVSAYAVDKSISNNTTEDVRMGWGIIFKIEDTNCTTVNLYGRDPYPAVPAKDVFIDGTAVYEYTQGSTVGGGPANQLPGQLGGLATVKIKAVDCPTDGTGYVNISTCIPGDNYLANGTGRFLGRDNLFGGRGLCAIKDDDPGFPYDPTDTSDPKVISVTIPSSGGPDCPVSMAITPDPATIQELTTQQFDAVVTLNSGATVNVTSSASWSTTGIVDLQPTPGLVQAQHVACSDSGSGTVSATYDNTLIAGCTGTSAAGPIGITVTNDDTQTGIVCAPGNVIEGASGTYTCNARYGTDTCEDVTASTSVGGQAYCHGSAGNYNIDNVCGNDSLADCTITQGSFTTNLAVNEKGDTVASITACPGPWTDNGTPNAYTCTYRWSDGLDCNDSNDICTSASSITGGCSGGAGSSTCASVCGNDDPTDATLTAAGKSCAVVVNDKGDTISGIAACPGPYADNGVANAYTCMYAWSSSQNCNDSNDVCTTDSTISGGCTGGNGTATCASVCGNDNPPDATLTASAQTCNIVVTDKGDSITGITACPGPYTDNGVANAYTCTFAWSSGQDCNDSDDDCTTASSITGGCSGTAGSATCANVCGNDDPSDATLTAATKTCAITVNDRGDSITGITACPGPYTDNDVANSYTCTYHWSSGCDGNDSNDICTSASTVSGGCSGGAGSATCASVCGNDNPPDATLSAGGQTCAITVTDKGDTITAISSCPGPYLDNGSANAYTCTYTWSSGQNCNDGDNICTTDSTISGGCTGGAGTATCASVCGNDNPPDATLTASTRTCTITVNDKGDTITGLNSCPASWVENASGTYTCLYAWSSGQNCNDGNDICTTQSTLSPAGVCTGGGGNYTTLNFCGDTNPPDCTITAQTRTCVVDVTYNPAHVVNTVALSPSSVTFSNPGPPTCGGNQAFTCLATWSDGCTDACPGTNCSELTGAANCNTNLGGANNCTWTSPASSTCTDTVSRTYKTKTGNASISNNCGSTQDVVWIWPAAGSTVPSRVRLNAHCDQGLTVQLLNSTAIGSYTATCGGQAYTCSQTSNYLNCTPGANLTGLTQYTCSVSVNGQPAKTGTMTTGACSVQSDGGFAGGYIGGNTYNLSTGRIADGSLTLQLVDRDRGTWTAGGNAYVQVIQGGTVDHWFTNTSGLVTITPLLPVPINELTMGYKCGTATGRCLITGKRDADNYNNYQYHTLNNMDARLITYPMTLTTSAKGGRFTSSIVGNLNRSQFNSMIWTDEININLGNGATQPRLRPLFFPPVKIRAGLVLGSLDVSGISLETLLASPDFMASISLCAAPDINGNNALGIRIAMAVALPTILVAPALLRTNWLSTCTSFATVGGKYNFGVDTKARGDRVTLMALGAWVNATNFSLSGAIDLFAFPIYGCALGLARVDTGTNTLSADSTIDIGTLNFNWDIRELWTMQNGMGYNPDAGADRRQRITIRSVLPIDPGRRDAWTWTSNPAYTYRVANQTDSELGTDWDKRYQRKGGTVVASGADTGKTTGLIAFGLTLNTQIDDADFTVFKVGYIASTGTKSGTSDIRPWSGGGETEVVSAEHAGITRAMAFGETGSGIDWTPTEDGGPTNFAGLVILMRGSNVATTPRDKWGLREDSGLALPGTNPGTHIAQCHVGPPGNAEAAPRNFECANRFFTGIEMRSPAPDNYWWPAVQWSGTTGASNAINRNSELMRRSTVAVAAGAKFVQTDGGDAWGRRMFQFSNPVLQGSGVTLTADKGDWWKVVVGEDSIDTDFTNAQYYGGYDRWSAKKKVRSDWGVAVTGGVMTDVTQRFVAQGVAVGDSVIFRSVRYAYNCGIGLEATCAQRWRISAVTNNRSITLGDGFAWGAGGAPAVGSTRIRYEIRRAAAKGDCLIDQWYGGGPDGYGCSSNTFWDSYGPILTTGNTLVAHFPAIPTPGSHTYHGVTANVPNIMDGLTSVSATPQITWTAHASLVNTRAVTAGGIGAGAWDWNNQPDFKMMETKIEVNIQEVAAARWQ